MSTTCVPEQYPSALAANFNNVPNESKTWVVAEVPNETEDKGKINIKKKVDELKRKFHHDRKLMVKHLPRNVKEEEIAKLLYDFNIKNIHLANNDDKSSTATVTLENPEVLDVWDNDRRFLLREQSVSVAPTLTEMLLCIARLPFSFTEDCFYDLIKEYGEVKMFFLMISERTGLSKGYGFVQYTSKENALVARNALNDKTIDTFQLVCDWLDSSHLTFDSLHSKCLYVDNLPTPFRDMSVFRAVFDRIVKPPYCQIALKKGCPLNWGLVEYLCAEDAELAQTSCHNHRLRNQPIRIVYFIPGIRAINLMLSLLDTPPRGKSNGLLPNPTGHSVRMSIENISKQNPIHAKNVQNIILSEIQESQHLKDDSKPEKVTETILPKGKSIEKVVLPTPPVTPTVVNGVPMVHPVHPVPLLPNTAIPPPLVDKVAFNPLINDTNYPVMWNDMIVPRLYRDPVTPDTATPPFALTPTQVSANLMHEVTNLPVCLQQNIFSSLNVAAPLSAVQPIGSLHTQYTPMTVNPLRVLFNGSSKSLLSPPQMQPQQLFTVPIVSNGYSPTSWPSMSSFVTPTGVPVFTTTADQWQTARMHSNIVSHPSTPIVHYTTGQKRKLLPSPEKSPEGNYIGQHSQGIGGHYADSYFKKKKMF